MARPGSQSGYAHRDRRVVAYEFFRLPGSTTAFRGPRPASLHSGEYFVCLGGAQTFGCLCETPYPVRLAQRLGLESLNLGYGGAGPGFFLARPALLAHVNRARFAVVQVMSGRSVENSLFATQGHELATRRADGKRMGARQAWDELLRSAALLSIPRPSRVALHIFAGSPTGIVQIVEETRRNWVRDTIRLLDRIAVPVVLLYISARAPGYTERLWSVDRLFAAPPELVNTGMIEAVRVHAHAYVESISRRGLPQRLVDRETGQATWIDLSDDRPDLEGLWTHNRYYPSPEMHEDAAAALEPLCRSLL